jgi:hypothetical protein
MDSISIGFANPTSMLKPLGLFYFKHTGFVMFHLIGGMRLENLMKLLRRLSTRSIMKKSTVPLGTIYG